MTLVVPGWINRVNIEHQRAKKTLKNPGKPVQSIHMHKIAKGLFDSIKGNNKYITKKLLKKVTILANEQLKYYKSGRFHFIEQFFSALRNLFILGSFHSSAYLSQKFANQLLVKSTEKKQKRLKLEPPKNQTETPEIPKDITKPLKDQHPVVEVQTKTKDLIINTKDEHLVADVQTKNNPITKKKQSHKRLENTNKKQLLSDLQNIWKKEANLENDPSSNHVKDLWNILLRKAKISAGLENLGNNSYRFKLASPICGSIKVFKFTVNPNIQFKISQNGSKKTIEFVMEKNYGFTGRFGLFEAPLKKVEWDAINATFTVEKIFECNYPYPAKQALEKLQLIQWDT